MKTKPKNGKSQPANALKHGAFSSVKILPGEHRAEYEELVHACINEFAPVGAFQIMLVTDIADIRWQIRRNERFFHTEIKWLLEEPCADRQARVFEILMLMARSNWYQAWQYLDYLPEAYRNALPCREPPENADETWKGAVMKRLEELRLAERHGATSMPDDVRSAGKRARRLSEAMETHLGRQERLERLHERALRRWYEMKTFEKLVDVPDPHVPCRLLSPSIVSNS